MSWWHKKDPEPETEDEAIEIIATPWAGRVNQMFAEGFTPRQIVLTLQDLECELARAKAEMNLSATTYTKPRADRVDRRADKGADTKRRKWRRQKKNQRARQAQLRLVTGGRTGDDAA